MNYKGCILQLFSSSPQGDGGFAKFLSHDLLPNPIDIITTTFKFQHCNQTQINLKNNQNKLIINKKINFDYKKCDKMCTCMST